jgi:hypothetical protein
MLNGIDTNRVIKCRKKGGFDNSAPEVLGLLPMLHMNIKKDSFYRVLRSCEGDMHKAMASLCNAKDLNTKLKGVDFNCDRQTHKAVDVLIERFVDTIEFTYNTRVAGKKHAAELAAHMRWQHKNGIIPESSIKWCEGMRSAPGVSPA